MSTSECVLSLLLCEGCKGNQTPWKVFEQPLLGKNNEMEHTVLGTAQSYLQKWKANCYCGSKVLTSARLIPGWKPGVVENGLHRGSIEYGSRPA